MSGNIDTLMACVAICADYRPESTETDRWRRAFDRLSGERRAVEKRLILDDRARLAMMAADAVILAANAPDRHVREQLLGMSFRLALLAGQDLFKDSGNFVARELREAGDA